MKTPPRQIKNILLVVMFSALSIHMGQAQTYFSDSYSTTDGGSTDLNDQIGSPRQGGTLLPAGGVSYSSITPDAFRTQVNNNGNPGLLLASSSNNYVAASPNIDLPTTNVTINFGLQLTSDPSANAFSAVNFGSAHQDQFVNAANGGLGILFKNDGSYQVFEGSSVGNQVGSGTSTQLAADAAAGVASSIQISIISGAGVALYIDSIQQDINGSAAGDNYNTTFGDNYVTFSQYNGTSSISPTYFTDLEVDAAVPEPSTIVTSILMSGAVMLAMLRRQRARA